MSRSYQYTTDCTAADTREIVRMRVFAREVKSTTFLAHCQSVKDLAQAYDYSTIEELLTHPGIAFFKSKYQRRPCYYVRIDGVKHVWTLPED